MVCVHRVCQGFAVSCFQNPHLCQNGVALEVERFAAVLHRSLSLCIRGSCWFSTTQDASFRGLAAMGVAAVGGTTVSAFRPPDAARYAAIAARYPPAAAAPSAPLRQAKSGRRRRPAPSGPASHSTAVRAPARPPLPGQAAAANGGGTVSVVGSDDEDYRDSEGESSSDEEASSGSEYGAARPVGKGRGTQVGSGRGQHTLNQILKP